MILRNMKRNNIDQSYTMIDIKLNTFDDDVISGLMSKYPKLASARIEGRNKFSESGKCLKFYIHHMFFDNRDAAIKDIMHAFKGNEISIRTIK